jgi:hypothetical protein
VQLAVFGSGIRGFLAEGREWLALDAVDRSPNRLHARGLYAAALFAILQGDYAAGRDCYRKV